MTPSALSRVHQVQARLHVRRKFSLQEIQDDSPCRCRLNIALADRRRGIHDHDVDSRSSGRDCYLFRHELRTLVVPDHVCQRHRTLFIRDSARVGTGALARPSRAQLGSCVVRSEAHGRNTRRVHHAPHTLFPRRFEQGTRALNIRAVHLARIAHPQPVLRRNVKYNIATGKHLRNRPCVAQVADNAITLQVVNVAKVAGRPNQQPQLGSLFRQDARNMTPQKSRGAGNESEHLAVST